MNKTEEYRLKFEAALKKAKEQPDNDPKDHAFTEWVDQGISPGDGAGAKRPVKVMLSYREYLRVSGAWSLYLGYVGRK